MQIEMKVQIMNETVKKLVDAYGQQLIDNRRYLHAHPELSFSETHTAAWVREHLQAAGIPMLKGIHGNSTVGYLKGTEEGPAIGFRADIDALGLTEENDLPYKSQNCGVMHACGHDAHTAVLMAMAELLAQHKEMIHGTIYFIFQQAEEYLPGGAKGLVEDGLMDTLDYIFGWHVGTMDKVGTADISAGVRTAAVGTYDLKITGKGGHGGSPHQCNNPIIPAAELVSAIHLIPALKCDPLANCTVSVSNLICGVAGVDNVLPETVVMGGNIRSLRTEVRDFAMSEIKRLAESISAAHQCHCDVHLVYGYPALEVDETCAAIMAKAAKEVGLVIERKNPSLGAEDFAYYSQKKPSGYAHLGMADPKGVHAPTPHHNPRFYIDDAAGLPLALQFILTTYVIALQEIKKVHA